MHTLDSHHRDLKENSHESSPACGPNAASPDLKPQKLPAEDDPLNHSRPTREQLSEYAREIEGRLEAIKTWMEDEENAQAFAEYLMSGPEESQRYYDMETLIECLFATYEAVQADARRRNEVYDEHYYIPCHRTALFPDKGPSKVKIRRMLDWLQERRIINVKYENRKNRGQTILICMHLDKVTNAEALAREYAYGEISNI